MDITSDIHSRHISRQFNQELEELKTHLMAMGGLVEKQIQEAVEALLESDSELARRVVEMIVRSTTCRSRSTRSAPRCWRAASRRPPICAWCWR